MWISRSRMVTEKSKSSETNKVDRKDRQNLAGRLWVLYNNGTKDQQRHEAVVGEALTVGRGYMYIRARPRPLLWIPLR